MPAKSEKQKKFMDAAAHNPAFAKKVGIPSKVAKEYSQASKGMKFKRGGDMKKIFAGKETKAEEAKERKAAGSKAAYKKMEKKFEGEKYARGGGVEKKGKTKGTMVKMAAGGSVSKRADGIAKKGRTSCKVM